MIDVEVEKKAIEAALIHLMIDGFIREYLFDEDELQKILNAAQDREKAIGRCKVVVDIAMKYGAIAQSLVYVIRESSGNPDYKLREPNLEECTSRMAAFKEIMQCEFEIAHIVETNDDFKGGSFIDSFIKGV